MTPGPRSVLERHEIGLCLELVGVPDQEGRANQLLPDVLSCSFTRDATNLDLHKTQL